ncbi:MAG: HNH endonuclease [Alphaproteobacteria bacterium]
MVDGPSVDRHHLVPKTEGGRDTVVMHRICHRKIHSVLSERELATGYADLAALKAHPEIARFVRWVRRKPAEFHKRTEPARRRR